MVVVVVVVDAVGVTMVVAEVVVVVAVVGNNVHKSKAAVWTEVMSMSTNPRERGENLRDKS